MNIIAFDFASYTLLDGTGSANIDRLAITPHDGRGLEIDILQKV